MVLIAKIALDLTKKYKDFIKEENINDKQYDVVYILKQSENNPDLVYSLRSLDKFCNLRNIWIVGYKPTWVTNVKYIPTDQTQGKWANIKLNWETACSIPELSDDFILMNDDFIAINPIINWKESLNLCVGRIDERCKKYNLTNSSKWQQAFIHLTNIFKELGCLNFYDFEAHLPTIINKNDFNKMLQIPEIKTYWEDDLRVFHQRSACKNLYWNGNTEPKEIKDVKLITTKDMSSVDVEDTNWISVADNVIGNEKLYPKLNCFLKLMFPNKSRFEL